MNKQNKLTRRDFLKCGGLGTVGLIAAGLLTGHTGDIALASTESNEDAWGILIDLTRCTGCNSCALACKEANNLAHPNLIPHELDSDSYCFVDQYATGYRIEGNHGFEENQFVKRQCMHCLDPACVSACTVGALHKTPEGPVVYDAYKCIGCRYCQYACPFGVPAYEWENPLGLIHKCQMCVTRLAEGQQPACVEACPNGSIRFGKRTALLGQARALIDSNPHRYIDHIYGEHEAGGTSVLYLSTIPFSEIGFPELDSHPIPRYAEKVMNMTPAVALGVATGATVLHSVLKGKGHDSESEEA